MTHTDGRGLFKHMRQRVIRQRTVESSLFDHPHEFAAGPQPRIPPRSSADRLSAGDVVGAPELPAREKGAR